MRLGKPILFPHKQREPFFNGADLESRSYKFKCSRCNKAIKVNCFAIYTGAWSRHFSDDTRDEVERLFGVSLKNNVSMARGWPSLTMHYCSKCGMPYIVLADFHEYMNSVYVITMQGIARWY